MKVKDIIQIIETKFPIETAIEDDREKIGYEVFFNKEKEIDSVIVTLDITEKIIDYAVDNNIKLIITHHPFFYNGIDAEVKESKSKNEILSIINRNEIEIYAAHTNTDVGENGLSYEVLKSLGIKPIAFLDEETKMGAMGYLEERLNVSQVIAKLIKVFSLKNFKYWAFKDETCQRVAFVSGAGSYLIPRAKEKSVELLITSDIPWHNQLQLSILGLQTIEVSHNIENIFTTIIEKAIKSQNESFNVIKFHVPDISKTYSAD